MHTIETISRMISDNHESDLPDRVLESLRRFDGKLITTRILDALPGGRGEWRMVRHFGWTEIENIAYWTSRGYSKDGCRLILARSESSVPLDLPAVEKDNIAYFQARRERNRSRMEARNTREILEALALQMNRIDVARATLNDAKAEFDTLTEYGTALNPDKYYLQEQCGYNCPK